MTTFNNQKSITLRGKTITEPLGGGAPLLTYPWVQYQTTVGKKWTGADDPGWKTKIEQGVSATNAYTSEFSYLVKWISARTKTMTKPHNGFGPVTSELYGYAPAYPTWNEALVKSMTNITMGKLYGVLQEIASPVAGLEFLAEFRKSVQMIKSPVKSLGDYLNKHLSKQVKAFEQHQQRKSRIFAKKHRSHQKLLRELGRETRRFSKIVAQLRLEYKFGWEPLVRTVGAAAKAAVDTFPEKGVITTYRKSHVQTVENSSTSTNSAGRDVWYQTVTDVYEYKVTLVMRVRQSGQYAGMSELEQLVARSGFLKSQLIPLAWELTPLSVFEDYFMNVGQVLAAACTETKDVTSVDRYVRRRLVRRVITEFRYSQYGPKDPTMERKGLVVQAFGKYTREKWSMSIPPLRFTTPLDNTNQLLNLTSFVRLAFFK